jgi:hypothetical protein
MPMLGLYFAVTNLHREHESSHSRGRFSRIGATQLRPQESISRIPIWNDSRLKHQSRFEKDFSCITAEPMKESAGNEIPPPQIT